jgi:IS30 family transposase
MPRYAPNKMPTPVKRRYFELIRSGLSGSAAAQQVGMSLSCGSVWFVDAGRVSFIETPISPRYLSQDDRIEIADGLARGEPVKVIAARIGKCFQSIYREIARNRKPDGRYQPWYAHNRAYQRRRRPKLRRFSLDAELVETVAGKLAKRWSPAQISRWLRRRYRRRRSWHVCTETIYEAVYRGLIVPVDRQNLRTGRVYRHRRRGRTRAGALKQSTIMKSIHQRPSAVASRRQAGHWEGDLLVGAEQRSAIATLVERKFRLTILVPVPRDHSAQSVGDALIGAFTKVPARLRRTLTWD